MKTLETEGPEIWEIELAEVAGDELAAVRASLASAIIEKSSTGNLESASTQVMGGIRTALRFASVGQRVDEARLRNVVEAITDTTLRDVVRASGNLILKVQKDLPRMPRGYIDVHLAFEANRVITQSGESLH